MRNDRDKYFPWGKIVNEYELGPYHIIEYHPWSNWAKREFEKEKLQYHLYVDGHDTRTGANTLEGAMLEAIAHRKLGPHATGLALLARALKLDEYQD